MKSMWREDRYTQSKNEKMFILIKKTCSLHMTGSFYGCLLKRQWTILASSNITYIWRMLVALHSSAHSSCICMQLLAVWTAAGSRIYYCFKYFKKVLNWTFALFMQIPICLFGAATFSFYPCSDTPTSTCCTANKWALLQPVYFPHLLPFTAWR